MALLLSIRVRDNTSTVQRIETKKKEKEIQKEKRHKSNRQLISNDVLAIIFT